MTRKDKENFIDNVLEKEKGHIKLTKSFDRMIQIGLSSMAKINVQYNINDICSNGIIKFEAINKSTNTPRIISAKWRSNMSGSIIGDEMIDEIFKIVKNGHYI